MSFRQRIIDADATIAREHFDEAVERLAALGFDGPNILEAMAKARWLGYMGGSGEYFSIMEVDTTSVDGESEKSVIRELADLFEPHGYLRFYGGDGEEWGWWLNHRGHSFVEVGVSSDLEQIEPTKEYVEALQPTPVSQETLAKVTEAYDHLVYQIVATVIEAEIELDMEFALDLSSEVRHFTYPDHEELLNVLFGRASERATLFVMAFAAREGMVLPGTKGVLHGVPGIGELTGRQRDLESVTTAQRQPDLRA